MLLLLHLLFPLLPTTDTLPPRARSSFAFSTLSFTHPVLTDSLCISIFSHSDNDTTRNDDDCNAIMVELPTKIIKKI